MTCKCCPNRCPFPASAARHHTPSTTAATTLLSGLLFPSQYRAQPAPVTQPSGRSSGSIFLFSHSLHRTPDSRSLHRRRHEKFLFVSLSCSPSWKQNRAPLRRGCKGARRGGDHAASPRTRELLRGGALGLRRSRRAQGLRDPAHPMCTGNMVQEEQVGLACGSRSVRAGGDCSSLWSSPTDPATFDVLFSSLPLLAPAS